ncbi:MAG: acetamidase/formamidase family protein [Chloroflexi bacterium]|nr:acetamidase/formamidase family protein [Chloroflexota bacterium]
MSGGRGGRTVGRERITYHFGPELEPVLEIESGETVTFETLDASSGRVRQASDIPAYMRIRDPGRVNPASGPIAVRGAEAGDELRVEILAIELEDVGWCRLTPGAGVMRDEIDELHGMIFHVVGDELVSETGIRFPTRPMVGVIGTCPAEGRYVTAEPGPHGGNLDFNDVMVGTVAHLPVFVPGGLLALGDVHASMGDGEVSGTAVEISARVTVRVELVKGAARARPWFEAAGCWLTYGTAPDLEEAVRIAVSEMATFLEDRLRVSRPEAFLLISARGDVRIGQSARCGIDQTVRVLFPRLAPAGG